jgi:alpha-beta hydrolase superfamily lysophospholipase
VNVLAVFQAYNFTHFSKADVDSSINYQASSFEKIKTLILGVKKPKSVNTEFPTQDFETIMLESNANIECWKIDTENARGTVILFHGYGSKKSAILNISDEFVKLGFNTFLVDFMGAGGSEGYKSTIGFEESVQVKTAFEYIKNSGESNIYIYGCSMGAVAIMKAIQDFQINPEGIIIECPFGTMYETVCARFEIMNVPSFPLADLLVFWGGVINGFWAFDHNPVEYAKKINIPTLLTYGELDNKVSKQEIDDIFENINAYKELKTFKNSGHENYLFNDKELWVEAVDKFLNY